MPPPQPWRATGRAEMREGQSDWGGLTPEIWFIVLSFAQGWGGIKLGWRCEWRGVKSQSSEKIWNMFYTLDARKLVPCPELHLPTSTKKVLAGHKPFPYPESYATYILLQWWETRMDLENTLLRSFDMVKALIQEHCDQLEFGSYLYPRQVIPCILKEELRDFETWLLEPLQLEPHKYFPLLEWAPGRKKIGANKIPVGICNGNFYIDYVFLPITRTTKQWATRTPKRPRLK